jgi:hypothetical protein
MIINTKNMLGARDVNMNTGVYAVFSQRCQMSSNPAAAGPLSLLTTLSASGRDLREIFPSII